MAVKIGVVGGGAIAQEAHLPSYASLKDVEIVGVADINEKRARSIVRKYRCKGYGDFTKLIDENDLDASALACLQFDDMRIRLLHRENSGYMIKE